MGALEQPELPLIRRANSVAVPVELIRSKKTAGAAFSLACDASGLEDKEIHLALDIDAGTFSRIKSGRNSICPDKIAEFCRVVGNTIYPEWIAYQIGCGLVMLKSEAERRAEEAEGRAAEAEKKLAWALEIINGKAPK